jgi:hypothetical protein
VAVASPHNKIINAVARARLRPLGLQQNGRSRLWYDDRGWHAIVVEFQASSYSKMSYLNVSLSWFWYPSEIWTFDVGFREDGTAEFHEEEQFQRDFERLADEAIEAVRRYRSSFASLQDAWTITSTLCEQNASVGWPNVHLGLLAALNGDAEHARERLHFVVADEIRTEWQAAQRAFCEKALDRIGDAGALRSWIEENIAACRQLRGLPTLEGPALPDR